VSEKSKEPALVEPISEFVPNQAIRDLPEKSLYDPSKKASGMLLFITLLWGLSFPLMKNWLLASENCPGGPVVAGLTMVALRMTLALLVLGVLLPKLFLAPSRREFGIGLLLGLINSTGFAFQVTGLAWTSPALSAFVTSLASAWVPLLMFFFFHVAIRRLTLAGLIVGISGRNAILFFHLVFCTDDCALGSIGSRGGIGPFYRGLHRRNGTPRFVACRCRIDGAIRIGRLDAMDVDHAVQSADLARLDIINRHLYCSAVPLV
jgi:hypothetical protein